MKFIRRRKEYITRYKRHNTKCHELARRICYSPERWSPRNHAYKPYGFCWARVLYNLGYRHSELTPYQKRQLIRRDGVSMLRLAHNNDRPWIIQQYKFQTGCDYALGVRHFSQEVTAICVQKLNQQFRKDFQHARYSIIYYSSPKIPRSHMAYAKKISKTRYELDFHGDKPLIQSIRHQMIPFIAAVGTVYPSAYKAIY
jgi:hypothetical protein